MSGITFSDIAMGGQPAKFASLLCVKREAFKHEAEVRLLFQDIEPTRGMNGAFVFPLDANAVFDEVILDPRLDSTAFATLQGKLNTAGLRVPVRQSDLYQAPFFHIRAQ